MSKCCKEDKTIPSCECKERKQLNPKALSFDDYYHLTYLPAHSKVSTRRWHFVGLLATIVWIVTFLALAIVSHVAFLIGLLISPFVVYPFAWGSHLYIEKNKPLAWSNPLWAKACDWRMCYDMLRGKF
jgi:hypothetical protein